MNVRHLSTHNTKGFFSGMKEGDQFTYPRHNYSPDRIRKMAARAGLKVADCENQNAGNLARGWTQCAVTGKIPQGQLEFEKEPEGNFSDTKEAYLAATHLMTLKLNVDDPAYRAAFLIRNVIKGTLASHFRTEHARMKDREFEHYYGAPLQKLLLQAWRLEHLQNDPEGVNAATVVANAAAGVCKYLGHNFAHLLAAGIPEEIGEWASGFRGSIIRIDRLPLSDDLDITQHGHGVPMKAGPRIVTARETSGRGEWKYYSNRDWHVCHSTYEEAVLFGMFGKDHYGTVVKLYRAIGKEE